MKLKQLLTDDDAVSPVIGVILMVAITVILAAVIGTFVLGLGDRVSEAQPNAQFTFEYAEDEDTPAASTGEYVNITHDGGDGVESSQLEVQVGDDSAWSAPDSGAYDEDTDNWDGDKITAGDRLELYDTSDNIEDGDAVKIIWSASGSDKTAVIGESEVSF